MKTDITFIQLTDDKKLLLTKGEGWRDSYLESIIVPFLNGEVPPNTEQINSSRNARIWKATAEESLLFVKHFSFRGIRDRLFLRRSRSRRAMEGGIILSERGFYTPVVIAQGDLIKGLRILDNFLITQWIAGFNIYTYIKTFFKPPFVGEALQKKRNFITTIGRLIGQLHKKGIFHGDLRPGNILIRHSDGEPGFYFVDNERNRFFNRGIPERLREKNLVQINMILLPQITFTDRIRFFKAYLKENPELEPVARNWVRKVFLKTKKRLQKRVPMIWETKENSK